ncbi:hypothetical protein FRC11_002258, partial [Ceratobasidium sp. 423]
SSCGRKAHWTPLHDILALLALPPTVISPRQPHNPYVEAPKCDFPSKEEVKSAAETDRTRFQIFADGSHSQDGVGAAAALFRHGTPSTTAGLGVRRASGLTQGKTTPGYPPGLVPRAHGSSGQ